MSNIAFLLSFCSIFIPGILWNHIVITYSRKRKPSDTIFIIWSFIFGFWVYGIEWFLFIISSSIFKLLSTSIVLLCLLLLIVLSVFLHLEKLYKLNKSIKTYTCKNYTYSKTYRTIFKWFSIIIIVELLLLHYVHHYHKKLTNISLPDFHNLDFVNLYVVSIIILSLPVAFLLSCFHLWLNEQEILLCFLQELGLTRKAATEADTWEVMWVRDEITEKEKIIERKVEVWDFEKGIIVTGTLQNMSETNEPKALFLTCVTVESFYCEGNRIERKEIEMGKEKMYMDVEKALVFILPRNTPKRNP